VNRTVLPLCLALLLGCQSPSGGGATAGPVASGGTQPTAGIQPTGGGSGTGTEMTGFATFAAFYAADGSEVQADGFVIDDFNGDGNVDYAVTADQIYVFFGPIDAGLHLVTTADATLASTADGGIAARRAGDVDHDGHADLLVLSIAEDWLVSVPETGTSDPASAPIATLTKAADPIGGFDADSDGEMDLLVYRGSFGLDIAWGPFSGAVDISSPQPSDTTIEVECRTNSMVTPFVLGDVNGDEIPEMYLGFEASPYDAAACEVGLRYVMSMNLASGTTVDAAVAAVAHGMGGLAPLGDIDGDGVVDVSEVADDIAAPIAVWSGSLLGAGSLSGAPLLEVDRGSGYIGSPLGDLDGDGRSDLEIVDRLEDITTADYRVLVTGGEAWPSGIADPSALGELLPTRVAFARQQPGLDLTGDDLADPIATGVTSNGFSTIELVSGALLLGR
jgi:hypothetical protein